MDDFSQIIGVILAIGFFLYSAFKKKNEKKINPLSANISDSQMEMNTSSEGSNIIIDEQIEQKKTCFKTHESLINSDEGVSQHTGRKGSENVKPIDNDKSGVKLNLKQAVIHSEILNRKYF